MEYYSSDEDVIGGPLTLKEIKRDLLVRSPVKPPHRYTDTFCILNRIPPTYEDQTLDEPNKNNDFLNKLTSVINDETQSGGEKSFVTALDHTNHHLESSVESFDLIDALNITESGVETSFVTASEQKSPGIDTILKYLQSEGDETTKQLKEYYVETTNVSCSNESDEELARILQNNTKSTPLKDTKVSLVENTILGDEPNLEDSIGSFVEDLIENISGQDVNDKLGEKALESDEEIEISPLKNTKESSLVENTIILSDDDDDCILISDEDEYENPQPLFKQEISNNDSLLDTTHVEDSLNSSHVSVASSKSFEYTPNYEASCSNISEKNELTEKMDNLHLNTAATEDEFNDTLSEIEALIKRGLENQATLNTPKPIQDPILTGSFLKKPQKFPTNIPKPMKKSNIPQPNPSSINKFKTPNKPVLKVKPTINSKQFKNIVSPISVYIKNSPSPCLKENIHPKTIPSLLPKFQNCNENEQRKLKESNCSRKELPCVVYKPGKTIVSKINREIVLPASLQKMVQEPILTQHVRREFKGELESTSFINEKLLEGDLTTCSMDSSNVSFVVKNQAFKK